MRLRMFLTVLVLSMVVFLAGGCWDVEEIDRRAVIVALGLDTAPGGGVMATAELPLLQRILPPSTGGGGNDNMSFTLTGKGDLVHEAVPLLQSKLEMALFCGQIKAVVIGASLARQGLRPYLDALARLPEIPRQAILALTRGRAAEIVGADLAFKDLPAFALVGFFRTRAVGDWSLPVRLWQFLHAIDTRGDEPEEGFLPLIGYDRREKVYILEGLGVFRGDRLVGELTGRETQAFGLLTARADNAVLRVPMGRDGQMIVCFIKARTSVRIAPGNRPRFLTTVHAHGFLSEMSVPRSPLPPARLRGITQAAARTLGKDLRHVVRRLQQLNADILGYGELLRAKRPDLWRRIDWQKEFPRTEIRVRVDFEIGRTGRHR